MVHEVLFVIRVWIGFFANAWKEACLRLQSARLHHLVVLCVSER